MTSPAVEYRNITMKFGDNVAVENINLTIEEGEFAVLLGPSGGGKTTLLNMLGGFLTPTEGQVLLKGQDVTQVPPAKRATTTVFQDYALFPHMTVGANIGFGLKMKGVAKPEITSKIQNALDMVGLADMGERRIHELSGGQRQRIAMARALVVEPTVLLLDEPLGALDMKLRRQLQEELKTIQKRTGTTFVHVTHDQEEAMAIADTIIVMNDGFIEDSGSPEEIYLRPKTRFSANFMGENNLIDGIVKKQQGATISVETAVGTFDVTGTLPVDKTVALSLRPEHIQIEKTPNVSLLGAAVIKDFGFFGTHHQARVKFDGLDQDVRVRLPQTMIPKIGQSVDLFAKKENFVLLTS